MEKNAEDIRSSSAFFCNKDERLEKLRAASRTARAASRTARAASRTARVASRTARAASRTARAASRTTRGRVERRERQENGESGLDTERRRTATKTSTYAEYRRQQRPS
ncbi:hypothetical protein, partial [Priestia megaterium]|uniref:hypothetical protein n=1 Tax=Priestia megaterium TaxID=1404 RepID=UPI0019108CA0